MQRLCGLALAACATIAVAEEDVARWTASERETVERVLNATTVEKVPTDVEYREHLRSHGFPVMTYAGRVVYPREQVRKNVQGCVLVEFMIRADGKTDEFEILKSEPEGVFDKLALQVIYATEFEPIETAKRHRYPVTFFLGRPLLRQHSLLNGLEDAKREKRRAELVRKCEVVYSKNAAQAGP